MAASPFALAPGIDIGTSASVAIAADQSSGYVSSGAHILRTERAKAVSCKAGRQATGEEATQADAVAARSTSAVSSSLLVVSS